MHTLTFASSYKRASSDLTCYFRGGPLEQNTLESLQPGLEMAHEVEDATLAYSVDWLLK